MCLALRKQNFFEPKFTNSIHFYCIHKFELILFQLFLCIRLLFKRISNKVQRHPEHIHCLNRTGKSISLQRSKWNSLVSKSLRQSNHAFPLWNERKSLLQRRREFILIHAALKRKHIANGIKSIIFEQISGNLYLNWSQFHPLISGGCTD